MKESNRKAELFVTFYTLADKQRAVSKRYLYADNSGAVFMEMKSISYGILGARPLPSVLDSVGN